MHKSKTLYKRAKSGKTQQWKIAVENNDDGSATIVTTYGQKGGQQQEDREPILYGKNEGKKNATTPQQQADAEAEAKFAKKHDRDRYGLTVEESDEKMLRAPMLAHVYEAHATKVDWSSPHLRCQPKFDGHRCFAIKDSQDVVTLWSRKNVQITTCDHLVTQLGYIMPRDTMFDGELYIHGEPLNKLASFIKRKQERTADLCYMMYDMVDRQQRFVSRFAELSRVLKWHESVAATFNAMFPHLHLARTQEVTSEAEAMAFQVECIENGYEGAMLRHGDFPYESGARSHGLLKMKTFQDAEFEIVDCKAGKVVDVKLGAELISCIPAIFTCITPDGNLFDVMAQGPYPHKHRLREEWPAHKGRMLTVKYQEYSATEKPVPIFPVALQFREDV